MGGAKASAQEDLIRLYDQHDFLQSFLLTQIGSHLDGTSRNVGGVTRATKRKRKKG